MSRVSKKIPSVCSDIPLDDPDILTKINLMKQLLTSCFGPSGRLKQIHNNVGGHVLTTSTSSILLHNVSSSQPLVKLTTTSILNHVSRFSDCGLFTGILIFALIDHARQSNLTRGVARRVNKQLLEMCMSYLQEEDCGCKVHIDFCSCQNLITLAKSVITSKPAYFLTEKEVLHMSTQVVQAFLLTVPSSSSDKVCLGQTLMVSIEGQSVLDSAVFPGLLIDMPYVLHPVDVEKIRAGPLRFLLFSTSLSGDISDLAEGTLEMHREANPECNILKQLLELGEQAVKHEVNIFACQKVIHPVLQHYLRDHDIVVIERLGIALMQPISLITGAKPVATFQTPIPLQAYGQVKELDIKHFGSKEMIHLLPPGEPVVCTLVLCHRNETMLNELKVACQKAEHILRLTLREPSALLGGGCTETHLAAYIRSKGITEVAEATLGLGCSQTEYLLGVEGFCRSLESVARALEHDGGASLIDLTHGHHWTVPEDMASQNQWSNALSSCGCGLLESSSGLEWNFLNTRYSEFSPAPLSRDTTFKPRVLDSFTAKINALRVAVETANLVLDIRYMIKDVN